MPRRRTKSKRGQPEAGSSPTSTASAKHFSRSCSPDNRQSILHGANGANGETFDTTTRLALPLGLLSPLESQSRRDELNRSAKKWQFFGAPRTPNARAQRALGVPQAPLSGAQRRRTPKTRAQRARRRRRPYGGAQRRCTPKTRAQRAPAARSAAAGGGQQVRKFKRHFRFRTFAKILKIGTNRLRRFSPVRSGASARFLPQGSTAHGRKGERLGEITGQGSRARGRRAASCGRCSLRRSPRSRRLKGESGRGSCFCTQRRQNGRPE